jgi:hypothetical protein
MPEARLLETDESFGRSSSGSLIALRRVLPIAMGLLVSSVACAGPHTTGALWVEQFAAQEKTYFSTDESLRHAQTVAFQSELVDEGVAAERQRLNAMMQVCPGPPSPLVPSVGDQRRDALRIQSGDDPERLEQIARLALMDWYLRRASASGDAGFCARAARARDGTPASSAPADLLQTIPTATVTRAQGTASETPATDPPLVSLSRYAMGSVDTVTADAPLPQYLAWVYGGLLLSDVDPSSQQTAAAMVDAQAAAYPGWEPDALYAALRGPARP